MCSVKVQFLCKSTEACDCVCVFFYGGSLIIFSFFLLGNWSVQTLPTGINLVSCAFLKLSINLGFQIFCSELYEIFSNGVLSVVYLLPFLTLCICAFFHFFFLQWASGMIVLLISGKSQLFSY